MKRSLDYYKLKLKIVNNDVRAINSCPELRLELELFTRNCITNDISERLFWLRHSMVEYPTCVQCEARLTSKGFINGIKGYREFCSRACQRRSNSYKIKVVNTSRAKYNTDHPFSSSVVQDKRRATNLKRYGAYNPVFWSGELFKSRMITKYGEASSRHVPEIDQRIRQSIAARNEEIFVERVIEVLTDREISPVLVSELDLKNRSKLITWQHSCGQTFQNCLADLHRLKCPTCQRPPGLSALQFEVEQFVRDTVDDRIIRNDRTVIGPREIDIYLPGRSLGIEVHGDYWHTDLYVSDDLHQEKCNSAQAANVDLIQIFESEWRGQPEVIKAIIRSRLQRNSIKVHARRLEISEISAGEAYDFLAAYHLQRAARSSINFGLRENGKLMSLMTFGRPRFNRAYEWELVRFCTLPNVTVNGGASKLLKRFENEHSPRSLISYADRRISNGNLYTMLGFTQVGITNPNYWYVNFRTGTRVSRYAAQKKKLPKLLGEKYIEGLTEYENMKLNLFHKISDAGNLIYEKLYV